MTQTIQKTKRLFALILTLATICSCTTVAQAAEFTTIEGYDITTYGSAYLGSYSVATVAYGSTIYVDYTVIATGTQDEVGVYVIAIQEQQSSGSWQTIHLAYGAANDGMIAYNKAYNAGTYVYSAEAGNTYRAMITVFAGGEDGSDSRTITSNTVTTT